MATLNNTFEGQTSSTTWSVANSGSGSGDAFSSLINSGTVTPIFDNAQTAHGTNSLHITAAATSTWIIRWTTLNGNSTAFRIYLRIVSSSAAQDIISVRNSGAQAFGVGISVANAIQIKNAAGTVLKTFTALSLNTWYRLEVQATIGTTTSNGTINAQYYAGDSTSPVETAYASGAAVNAGITNFVEFRFAKLTSAPTFEAFYDSIAATDASATPLGPYSTATTSTETVAVAESTAATTVTLGTSAETVTVAESASGVTVTLGTAAETATVGESATSTTVTLGTATELITVGESAAGVTVTTGTSSEPVTIGESAAALTVTIGTAAELATVAESAAGLTVTIGTASEPIAVAETTTTTTVVGGSATSAEPITVGESAAGLTISTGTATETVTVTETATGLTTTTGTGTELVTVTENAAAFTVTTGAADEAVALLDEAADAVTVFAVTLVEAITLAESMAIAHDLDLTISIGTPRSTAGMFVGTPQVSADVVGSPVTTTPVTIGRGV